MTEIASRFTASPPLVKAAIGADVTKDELGGPHVHVDASGVEEELARAEAAQAAASYRSANSMSYDDVIDPRQLRDVLLDALVLSDGRSRGPFEPEQHLGIDP
jgi:methylmalonyl-CoA decarboxylase subunit alpha